MTRNKLTAVLAASAALGLVLFAAGSTGVLASWQESTWGTSQFGLDEDYSPTGYARSAAGHGRIWRHITVGETAGTDVTRTDTDPGTSSTGWQTFSTDGIAALASLTVDGNSSATFDPTGQNSSTGATVRVADARSQMRNFSGKPTAISNQYMTSSGVFTADAVCPLDGGAPSTDMTLGGLKILDRDVALPGPNETVPIDISGSNRHFTGSLTRTQTTTDHSALSELTLRLDQTLILTHEWTMEMQLLRAECGIGISAQGSTFGTFGSSPAGTAPTDENEPAQDADTGQDTDTDQDDGTDAGDEVVIPSGPVDVAPGETFDVVATDGTRLGSARIEDVRATASESGGPTTVAVKMAITTSGEAGDGRLARMSTDDFRQILGGTPAPVERAVADAPALPGTLKPGSTYSGWIAFTADAAVRSARWQPAGTAGWTFSVSAAAVTLPDPLPPEVTTPEEPSETPEQPVPEEPAPEPPVSEGPVSEEPAVTPEQPVPTPEPDDTTRDEES